MWGTSQCWEMNTTDHCIFCLEVEKGKKKIPEHTKKKEKHTPPKFSTLPLKTLTTLKGKLLRGEHLCTSRVYSRNMSPPKKTHWELHENSHTLPTWHSPNKNHGIHLFESTPNRRSSRKSRILTPKKKIQPRWELNVSGIFPSIRAASCRRKKGTTKIPLRCSDFAFTLDPFRDLLFLDILMILLYSWACKQNNNNVTKITRLDTMTLVHCLVLPSFWDFPFHHLPIFTVSSNPRFSICRDLVSYHHGRLNPNHRSVPKECLSINNDSGQRGDNNNNNNNNNNNTSSNNNNNNNTSAELANHFCLALWLKVRFDLWNRVLKTPWPRRVQKPTIRDAAWLQSFQQVVMKR